MSQALGKGDGGRRSFARGEKVSLLEFSRRVLLCSYHTRHHHRRRGNKNQVTWLSATPESPFSFCRPSPVYSPKYNWGKFSSNNCEFQAIAKVFRFFFSLQQFLFLTPGSSGYLWAPTLAWLRKIHASRNQVDFYGRIFFLSISTRGRYHLSISQRWKLEKEFIIIKAMEAERLIEKKWAA